MRATTLGSFVLAASTLTAVAAAAQSLASRVAAAPDGVVHMEFASRPGVCGDGHETVGYRAAYFGRNFQSIGRWHDASCQPGPLRVTLDVSNGAVQRVRTQVGGMWRATDARVTDLERVSSVEASAYFFALVPRMEGAARTERLLLPAVLADAAPVVEPLLAFARDRDRASETRRAAIFWAALIGSGEGDARVAPALHAIAEDAGETTDIRAHTIFALTIGGAVPEREFSYLRGLYGRLGAERLQEAVLQAMHRDESATGTRWLVERVEDAGAPMRLRKSALFWAGQREATPTRELVRVYERSRADALREHAIFVLSQRQDDEAVDALMHIARQDRDTRMRGKALFWLASKDDPRVRQLIADLVLK